MSAPSIPRQRSAAEVSEERITRGSSWNFRQIRPTADFDSSAIDMCDQSVALLENCACTVTHDRFHLIYTDAGRSARPRLVDEAVQEADVETMPQPKRPPTHSSPPNTTRQAHAPRGKPPESG